MLKATRATAARASGAVHVGRAPSRSAMLGPGCVKRLGAGAAGAGRVHQSWTPPPVGAAGRRSRLAVLVRSTRRGSAARRAPRLRRRSRLPRSSRRRRSAGSGRGRATTYQDWSRWPARSRGSGLAGDRDREAAEDRVGGAAGLLRGVVQAFEDRRAVLRGRSRRGARGAGSISCTTRPAASSTSHADVRAHDRAAVGERRVGDRHLQRVRPAGRPGRPRAGCCRRPTRAGRCGPCCRAGCATAGVGSRPVGLAGQVDPGRRGRSRACCAHFCSGSPCRRRPRAPSV